MAITVRKSTMDRHIGSYYEFATHRAIPGVGGMSIVELFIFTSG
jgi:hypothetical protein